MNPVRNNLAGGYSVWSYGLRNPWRFTFEGNRIVIADVGQGQFEEINYLNINAAKGTSHKRLSLK